MYKSKNYVSKKNEKGITLVALIITIIVLLILAVVTIQEVQGNGIIAKAKEARSKTEESKQNELINLDNLSGYINSQLGEELVEELEVFDEMKTKAGTNFSEFVDVKTQYAAFTYKNLELFENSTVTRIDVPIARVTTLNNPFFTVYVVNKDLNDTTPKATYKVYLPVEQLENSTTVNKWISITGLDIKVGSGQTLAFGNENDTTIWAYSINGLSDDYSFYTYVTSTQNAYKEANNMHNLLFDVYLKKNKTISILGDSISTFLGWSNNANYNSTIENNAVFYPRTGFNLTVEDTWWKQVINQKEYILNVNNSWSGSYVTKTVPNQNSNYDSDGSKSNGMARATQLVNNNGIKPDIIAIFMGTNDLNKTDISLGDYNNINFNNLSTESTIIAEAYAIMVRNVITEYPEADIYCFTLLSNNNQNDTQRLKDFNTIIKKIVEHNRNDGYNIHIVDLYSNSGIQNNTIYLGSDLLHPNEKGMDCITSTFISKLNETNN